MRTEHAIYVDDARELQQLAKDSVELVVTSPPYPMIEMWDAVFGELNQTITRQLNDQAGHAAFELMHDELDKTWHEIDRVLVSGGIACINIGDATRNIGGSFRVFPNHARVINSFGALGFELLPDILWRKPVNSGTKFMGSGMLPPNAYATLEHEHLLIFRNGSEQRSFEPKSERRYAAAYFWEERNEWFSDIWMDIRGQNQQLANTELRERSAAFPLEIPYRLINMFSIYGDTVLDPFWGTGTTSLAAIASARNSIGYERQPEFLQHFNDRINGMSALSKQIVETRIRRHQEFVRTRQQDGNPPTHEAVHYQFPVMTRQERQIRFYVVDEVAQDDGDHVVTYIPSPREEGEPHAGTGSRSTSMNEFS